VLPDTYPVSVKPQPRAAAARETQLRTVEGGIQTAFAQYHQAVLAYAIRRTPNLADAEDVAAETFAVAWRRWAERPRQVEPWLYGIARKVLANSRRSECRRAALTARVAGVTSASSSDSTAQVDSRLTVVDALMKLEEADRECIFLTEWEQLSGADAARVLGCSTAAFYVRLHRARRRLMSHLNSVDAHATGRYSAWPGEEPTR
jgi:RNA polymerase sigma-70 factor, ECF subfamily